MEPKNTVTDLKRLIGKKFSDVDVQRDLKTLSYEVVQGPDDVPLVRVDYLGQRASFTPEQLWASLLSELKAIAEKDQGAKVTDCVIAVPMFYTEAQRRAVLDAAHIVGLNVLRLIHDTTASALAYGIYKNDLPADKPLHVAFVDAGHASLQVRGSTTRQPRCPVRQLVFEACSCTHLHPAGLHRRSHQGGPEGCRPRLRQQLWRP